MIEDSQLQQFITALGEDFELTGEEIADVLWLAVQRLKYNGTIIEIPTTVPEEKPWWSKLINLITQIGNSINKKQPQAASSVQSPATVIQQKPTVPLYPETPSSVTTTPSKVLPIRVPDAPSLREPLQVAQSLRPLMRKIASGRKVILDEIATAKRIAEHKIYLPIVKPETEPWLDLALVIDESQSMAIWRHTIEDLKRLVQNYGVFRDVRIWGLVTDETGEVKLLPRIGTKGKEQRFANPRELIDPNGRRLILVVSDCVSRLWYDGAIISPLQAWSQRQPLAILQMLPDWLWLRTGLGNGASVLLKSLAPGVANQKLEVEELLLRKDFALSEGIKIPVLTLDPDLASLWSEMVSGKSEAVTSGFVLPPQLESDEKSLPETEVAQLDAAGRITRFRQTASPIARKLAGLLAAAPVINLPVVRLIQDTLLPQSNQVHVAEVFLGGLLKPLILIEADTNPDTVQYDFMDDGIRQIFLKDAPVCDSAEVFDAVSQYVAQKLNKSLQEFVALLKAPGEDTEKGISAFAEVAIKVLKGLGGEYARFAEENLVNTSSVPNTNTGDVNSQEGIKAQLSTYTFDVATIEIQEIQEIQAQFVEKFGGGQGNRFLTRNLQLNGEGNQIVLSEGGQINATMEINHDCPECGTAINQIIVGIAGEERAQACVWMGGSTSNGWQTVSFSLNIPYTSGIYYIRTRYAQAYNREEALGWWKVDRPEGPTEEANIGAVVVVGVNQIGEYAGEYVCAVKWGGVSGNWHEGTEHLFISKQGEVWLRSRFGLAAMQNLTVEDQKLSWNFEDNQTAASITFKLESEDGYFWEGKQTGKLFEGWLQYPEEGRIDFRGKLVAEVVPQFLEFEVLTVNAQGRKIKREKHQVAEYYTEHLGNGITIDMISIPGGSFMMGSPSGELESYDDEKPQHRVTVPSFYMGRYPITQEQWRVVAAWEQVERELDTDDPSEFKEDYDEGIDRWQRPVESISWEDAKEFCDRLAKKTGREYRLPTEAEWEYACRAGTTTPFHFGETISTELANYDGNYTYGEGVEGENRGQTTPVGYFKVANNFGLSDMHGNVFTWCEDDWHENYQDAPNDGRAWLSGESNKKVIRGGSWDNDPHNCRSAFRFINSRDDRYFNFGFRVVCVAPRTT